MVRAAVRTLTLQMYGLEDEGIQQFLISLPASNFFNEVAITIAEHCQVGPYHPCRPGVYERARASFSNDKLF